MSLPIIVPVNTGKPAKTPKRTTKPVGEKQAAAKPKKEKPDPICEACRKRFGKPVPDYACEGCKEEQQKYGRRTFLSELTLRTVHLGDMEELGEQVPDNSIDAIFTDPEYIAESWQNAYARLAELASRALKPHGFLFTYAPQAHLDEIMDLLRYSTLNPKRNLQYFWIIQSLNKGPHQKAYKWNAICKHKPILVFQKADGFDDLHGSRRCFSDVVNGYRQKAFHPWQQSVHDVLGIISRFMVPGEILLDPYAGTGTSLIAANLLGMDWLGFEIDPKTHAIAVRELQQQPIALDAFGIAADAAECEREPAPEQKDASKQSTIDPQITKPRETEKHLAAIEQSEARSVSKEARAVEGRIACLDCANMNSCGIQDLTEEKDGSFEERKKKVCKNPRKDPEACEDCDAAENCKTHDPKAGCITAALEKQPKKKSASKKSKTESEKL